MWLQGHLDPFRMSEEAVDKRNKNTHSMKNASRRLKQTALYIQKLASVTGSKTNRNLQQILYNNQTK